MEKCMTVQFKGFTYTNPITYKHYIKWKCTEKTTKKCPAILKTNTCMYTNQRRFKRHNHLMLYPYGKYDWIYLCYIYKTQFLLRLYYIKTKKPFFR